MRLVSALCGSRFGRGVVVPGGVAGYPREQPAAILARLGTLEKQVTADFKVLMGTSSFLDRLRGTGPLTRDRAREHGALGPIGRASGYVDDARLVRPYDAYPVLAIEPFREHWIRRRGSPLNASSPTVPALGGREAASHG